MNSSRFQDTDDRSIDLLFIVSAPSERCFQPPGQDEVLARVEEVSRPEACARSGGYAFRKV
jgi:hypothetical protein